MSSDEANYHAWNAFLGAVLYSRHRGIVLRDREWSAAAEWFTYEVLRWMRERFDPEHDREGDVEG